MIWRNPWAWTGLLCLVLPVLIHLLSRAPADVRPFPSLRFINPSRLSPRRRTRPRDVLLLCIRLSILAAAVAALAGPVLLTAPRTGTPPVVRATVLDTSASMRRRVAGSPDRRLLDSATTLATAAGEGAGLHTLVRAADVHAGIQSALTWLSVHPGIHELVVLSDFQRGSVDSSTLSTVPAGYGVRLVRMAGAAPPDTFSSTSTLAVTRVRALADRTEMTWSRADAADAADAQDAGAQAVTTATPRFQLRATSESRSRALAAYAAAVDASGAGAWDASRRVNSSSLERLAPIFSTFTPSGFTPSDARVQIVYPVRSPARRTEQGTSASPFGVAGSPVTAAWMADLLVQIAAHPLLREVAQTVGASSGGTIDSSHYVVVATRAGVPLVQAAQDSSAGASRLLLFCLADAGSALSAALIAATSNALESGVGDSPGATVPATAAMPVHEREPLLLSDAELARWNRAAGDSVAAAAAVISAADAERGGPSDARWLWALALSLLVVEALVRRAGAPREHARMSTPA
ncbi:MAG: BatA domain-containing protein [Gemmatimonadota bacterium]